MPTPRALRHAGLGLGALGIAMIGVGAVKPVHVQAAEWTLSTRIAEQLEADSNADLATDGQTAAIGSTTSIDLNLGARTRRTQWSMSTGTRLSVFSGNGANAGLNRADPRASGGVIVRSRSITASAAFDYIRQPVAFTQFGIAPPPDGATLLPGGSIELADGTIALGSEFATVTQEEATQTDLRLSGAVTIPLGPRNRVSLAANGLLVQFSEDVEELVASTSYSARLGWAHDLTKLTGTDLAVTVERFTADTAAETRSTTVSFDGAVRTRLTPRLSLGANGGAALIRNSSSSAGAEATTLEALGGASLDWQSEAMRLSLSIGQSVESSSLGELQNRTKLALSAGYAINSISRIDLNLSYARQVSAGGFEQNGTRRQLFVFSPSYDRQLDRNWSMRTGYTLRLSDEETGFATSNKLFVTFSRSFDLLR